jgi:hypothetical protein
VSHPIPALVREPDERGASLVDLMVALMVMTLGVLMVGQLFPAGQRGQLRDRMMTSANLFAQEKLETLGQQPWTSADLSEGRHPSATDNEVLENGAWERYYEVETMPAPMDNLKKVTVTVTWDVQGERSVSTTTYIRR